MPSVAESLMTTARTMPVSHTEFVMMRFANQKAMHNRLRRYVRDTRPELRPYLLTKPDGVSIVRRADVKIQDRIDVCAQASCGKPPTVYQLVLPDVQRLHAELLHLVLTGRVVIVEDGRGAYVPSMYRLFRTGCILAMPWTAPTFKQRVQANMVGSCVVHGLPKQQAAEKRVTLFMRVMKKRDKRKRRARTSTTTAQHSTLPSGAVCVIQWSAASEETGVVSGKSTAMVLDHRCDMLSGRGRFLPVHAQSDTGDVLGVRTFSGMSREAPLVELPEAMQNPSVLFSAEAVWMRVCVDGKDPIVTAVRSSPFLRCRLAVLHFQNGALLSTVEYKELQTALRKREEAEQARRLAAASMALQREMGLGGENGSVKEEDIVQEALAMSWATIEERKERMKQLGRDKRVWTAFERTNFCSPFSKSIPSEEDMKRVTEKGLVSVIRNAIPRPFPGLKAKRVATVRERLRKDARKLRLQRSRPDQHAWATGKHL